MVDSWRIPGALHSVNPWALAFREDIFMINEREVTILETEHFGKLAYVEVGATCVGKIKQTHTEETFERGDEKGMFLFGGSTVIVLGEPGSGLLMSAFWAIRKRGPRLISKWGRRWDVRSSERCDQRFYRCQLSDALRTQLNFEFKIGSTSWQSIKFTR